MRHSLATRPPVLVFANSGFDTLSAVASVTLSIADASAAKKRDGP